MKINSEEDRSLIALSQRLESGNLTLDELREIEDTASLLQGTKTTRAVSQQFFTRLGEVKQQVVEKRAEELERDGSLLSRIEALKLRIPYLAPSEVLERFSLLERDLALEGGELEVATRALEDVQFFFAKSTVQELDPKHSDFLTRMYAIAEMCLQQHSMIPAGILNHTQQMEVGL